MFKNNNRPAKRYLEGAVVMGETDIVHLLRLLHWLMSGVYGVCMYVVELILSVWSITLVCRVYSLTKVVADAKFGRYALDELLRYLKH